MTAAKNNQGTCDVTLAQMMEAEERELVIENSVEDLEAYADKPLSDEEINAKRLHLEDIQPEPEDGQ